MKGGGTRGGQAASRDREQLSTSKPARPGPQVLLLGNRKVKGHSVMRSTRFKDSGVKDSPGRSESPSLCIS